MSARMVVLLAVASALWIFGLLGQLYSSEATMRYLVLSLGLIAIAVWRWKPQPALRRLFRDRRNTPERD